MPFDDQNETEISGFIPTPVGFLSAPEIRNYLDPFRWYLGRIQSPEPSKQSLSFFIQVPDNKT